MPTSFDAESFQALSSQLLALGKLGRRLAPEVFMRDAVQLVQEGIGFRSAWWGLVVDRGRLQAPNILQADVLGLPQDVAGNWRQVSVGDSFARDVIDHMGQPRRLTLRDLQAAGGRLPDPLAEFAKKHDICHAMGICLDEEATGQLFFVVLYRGESDPAFTDGQALWFRELVRHAVQLWYFNLQEAMSRVSSHGMGAMALVRADGHLLFAGGEFCELLYELWPDWDGVDLPSDLAARLQESPCMVRLGKGALNVRPQGDHFRIERMETGALGMNLSPRERRVAHLFAAGMNYKEIGRRLALSPATVRTYLRQAYSHLGVKNKVELHEALS